MRARINERTNRTCSRRFNTVRQCGVIDSSSSYVTACRSIRRNSVQQRTKSSGRRARRRSLTGDSMRLTRQQPPQHSSTMLACNRHRRRMVRSDIVSSRLTTKNANLGGARIRALFRSIGRRSSLRCKYTRDRVSCVFRKVNRTLQHTQRFRRLAIRN